MKEYGASDRWTSLGETPLQRVRVSGGVFPVEGVKPGFAFEAAFATTGETGVVRFSLDPETAVPTGMVRVPGGQLFINITELGGLGPYQLEPFYIDKLEVTNREFKQFVDQRGYGKRDYWKQPFVMDGRTLTWEEAMDRFRDATSRPGPGTWEGRYPEGSADYPVTGVSWYEAVAYAEFLHKSLPTIAHWYRARGHQF
jgi:formylglycine-generating enzyme required for sulfatase activity